MRLINAEVLKYWIKSGTKEGQKKVSLSKNNEHNRMSGFCYA